jgi:DNA-directed RNA polymerase specialized sigma24 family protein
MKEQKESSSPFSSMAQLIAALPEEERIVLTLFYLKSESAAAIAERLAVPERAVESVLISGRSRLLASLGLATSNEAHDHAQDGKQE